ncbi:MAG: hypothetical protein ACI3WU_00545 [Phascolarctobacterium sp.]
MQYVNKHTGEVYNVRLVDLQNLCDGTLNSAFIGELRKLVNELTLDSKAGCITIKIKVDKDLTPGGDTILRVEASIATKYPSVGIRDDNTKNITEDGLIVERIPEGLFDNQQEESDHKSEVEE